MRKPLRRLIAQQKLARERKELARIEADIARDPDMMLITRYVLNELSPDEETAFYERIEGDPAFEKRAGLIQAVWSLPHEHDAASDAATLDRAWAEFRERVGNPPELPVR